MSPNLRQLLQYLLVEEGYRGVHRAPGKRNGAPLWNVTQDIYPDDIYTLPLSVAARYYGTGQPTQDAQVMKRIRYYQNKPDKNVVVYRAVPGSISLHGSSGGGPRPGGDDVSSDNFGDDSEEVTINPGDWVTLYRPYAKEHGEHSLRGDYRILSRIVPARELFTDGNSIYEWGWDPSSSPSSSPEESHPSLEESALRGFSLNLLKKKTKELRALGKSKLWVIAELQDFLDKYKLPYLGSGSSRAVWALSSSKVIKLARNDKGGIRQNKAEVEVWTNPSTKGIAAEIYDFDSDGYVWVISELVKPLSGGGNETLEHILELPVVPVAGADGRLIRPSTGRGVSSNQISIDYVVEMYLALKTRNSRFVRPELSDIRVQKVAEKHGLGGVLDEGVGWIKELFYLNPEGLEIYLAYLKKFLQNPPEFVKGLANLIADNDLELGDIVNTHFGRTPSGKLVLYDYGFTTSYFDD